MRPLATFSFFIFFLQLFHFFTLLIALSSSLLLPPRPSLPLVAPSDRRTRPLIEMGGCYNVTTPFFIDFDKSVTDRPTARRADGRTDKASYRDARTHLKPRFA